MAETEPTRTLSKPHRRMVEVSAKEYHDTLGHLRKAVHRDIFGSDSGTAFGFWRSDTSSSVDSNASEPTRACFGAIIVIEYGGAKLERSSR